MIWDNQRAGSRGGGGMRFALPCGSSGQMLNAREWLNLVTEHGKGPKTSSQRQPWRPILIKQQPWQCLVQMLCSTILNCSFCDWFNMEILSVWVATWDALCKMLWLPGGRDCVCMGHLPTFTHTGKPAPALYLDPNLLKLQLFLHFH